MELRDLPAVDALAVDVARTHDLPAALAVVIAREVIVEARDRIRSGRRADVVEIASERAAALAWSRPRRVINATGVLLHTNLGRAPLPEAAVVAWEAAADGYGNVEFDLVTGRRGGRGRFVAEMAAALSGADAALVVNNNAGALALAVAAVAGPGARVAVSRGELIEIGGSFRLPAVISAAGATLVEVGTTNRTRRSDFVAVVSDVDLLLKVHPSNYRVTGFAEDVSWAEMAELAAAAGKPFIADVGSGLLDARTPWLEGGPPAWLAAEPGVRQTVRSGADVTVFSGDKLLGGPQAGVAVGRTEAIEAMRSHPLARAMRCDGPRLAALGAVLEMYADARAAQIPFWEMASLPEDVLRRRSEAVADAVRADVEIVDGVSLPGAGSVPGEGIPGPVLRVDGPARRIWRRLLDADVPVVSSIRDDAVYLDLRSVAPADDRRVVAALGE